MFAYVRYSDGHKHIVPIEDIKKFDPKNYKHNVLYLVRWENTYYQAQVLVIKETREEMEEELAKPSKRIRTAKIHNHHQDDEEDETATAKEKGELKKKNKMLKTVEASEKRKNLLKILEERKAKKREDPLFETDPKKKREECSDSEDGGVVPQKIHDDLQIRYRYIKKQKQDFEEKLEECKHKCAELEKEKEDLVAELATYRSLNITLQQNMNKVLQRAFSETSSSFLNGTSTPVESTPDRRPELPNSSEGNNPPLNKNPFESPLSLYEIKDGKIHIGDNIWIREEVWKKINSATKDSLYIKEMAVALWGTNTLKSRSVSGKECPTNKYSAKPPLTPSKLQILRVCFSDWLKRREPEKGEREKREKQVGYYISQKIQDIIKKERKRENV